MLNAENHSNILYFYCTELCNKNLTYTLVKLVWNTFRTFILAGDIFDVRVTFIIVLIMSLGDYLSSHAVRNKSCNTISTLINKTVAWELFFSARMKCILKIQGTLVRSNLMVPAKSFILKYRPSS
jgi:hypothetical protein